MFFYGQLTIFVRMKTYFRILLAASLAAVLTQSPAAAQFPGMPRVNRDSLRALTVADHARMMAQLGLKEMRPGCDPNSPDAVRKPNYDELTANPYLYWPDPLTTFSGEKVKDAEMWRKVRRPELVSAFENEVYGRVPENVPAIRWEVVKEEKVMMEDIPCIRRDQLRSRVDRRKQPPIIRCSYLLDNMKDTESNYMKHKTGLNPFEARNSLYWVPTPKDFYTLDHHIGHRHQT